MSAFGPRFQEQFKMWLGPAQKRGLWQFTGTPPRSIAPEAAESRCTCGCDLATVPGTALQITGITGTFWGFLATELGVIGPLSSDGHAIRQRLHFCC